MTEIDNKWMMFQQKFISSLEGESSLKKYIVKFLKYVYVLLEVKGIGCLKLILLILLGNQVLIRKINAFKLNNSIYF